MSLPFAVPEEVKLRPMFLAARWVRGHLAGVEVHIDSEGLPIAVRFPIIFDSKNGLYEVRQEVHRLTGKIVTINGWFEVPVTGIVTASLRIVGGRS